MCTLLLPLLPLLPLSPPLPFLFPPQDEQAKEEPFYTQRGIKRKASAIAQQTAARVSAENAASAPPVPRPMAADNAEETSFKLEPAPNSNGAEFGNM